MITLPHTGVWGWPWHGLATGGVIAGSGKTITQPPNGNAWLIDMGLPAISLTSAETTAAAANNYEWRNYAMISGGRLYDTALPAESFIHVDAEGKCWLVTLSYSYPASNTLRVTASIKRFGLFGHGAASAITKTVDIACEAIDPASYDIGIFDARFSGLEDVWTNGSKAIVGVWLSNASTAGVMFSACEITLNGTGGADGAGLSLTGAEFRSASNINAQSRNNGESLTYTCGGATWGSWDGSPISNYDFSSTWGKFAYYNSSGAACVARLRVSHTIQAACTGGSTSSVDMFCNTAESGYPQTQTVYTTLITVVQNDISSISLIENDSVIDELSRTVDKTFIHPEAFVNSGFGCLQTAVDAMYQFVADFVAASLSTTSVATWSGSLSANYDPEILLFYGDYPFAAALAAWRTRSNGFSITSDLSGGEQLGISHINAKSMAFYHPTATVKEWGTIRTPLGNKSYSDTALANPLYFAWQRKTGDYAFSSLPICYV